MHFFSLCGGKLRIFPELHCNCTSYHLTVSACLFPAFARLPVLLLDQVLPAIHCGAFWTYAMQQQPLM
jgi:hypothetical protein